MVSTVTVQSIWPHLLPWRITLEIAIDFRLIALNHTSFPFLWETNRYDVHIHTHTNTHTYTHTHTHTHIHTQAHSGSHSSQTHYLYKLIEISMNYQLRLALNCPS